MKTIHRLGLLALFAGILAAPASAQQRGDAQAHNRAHRGGVRSPQVLVERRVDRLDAQLNLTDRQEQEIRRILLAQVAARPGAFGEGRARAPQRDRVRAPRTEGQRTRRSNDATRGPVDPQARERVRAARERTHQQILSVLTPQQAETFRRLVAEERARVEQCQRRGGHEGDRQGRRRPR